MAEQEILYTIPLRKEMLKLPRYKRVHKAVRATRSFLIKHLKSEEVLIGQDLNRTLYGGGRRNPPTRIKVKVYKFKDKFIADTIDAPVLKEEEKKKGIGEKIKDTITGKKSPEQQKSETKEEKMEEEKKEILKHPPTQVKEKKAAREFAPKEKKVGEQELKKEVFSKTQKPKHEKRYDKN